MNTTEFPNPAEQPAEVGQVQRPVGRQVPERATPTPCNCPTRDALDAMLCDAFKRRATVEQALYDMAAGKLPMPNADKLRELARHLGTPGSPVPGADWAADMRAKLERPCCGTLRGSRHRNTCPSRTKTPNDKLSR